MGSRDQQFEAEQWEGASFQLPSTSLDEMFGEVNVRKTSEATEVAFTIRTKLEGTEAEGWQTGVALDASASMMKYYGKGLIVGKRGPVPSWLMEEYQKKGWVTIKEQDGDRHTLWTPAGCRDAIERGHFRTTENLLNPMARQMTAYLAGGLDADGGTTILYWGCGDGTACEVLGDFTAEQCRNLNFSGPTNVGFGDRTHLAPAIKYFCDRFQDAHKSIFLFLTDGRIADIFKVQAYSKQLAQEIQAGRRNPVKCVLIGFGDEVDERQMKSLDDLDTGTDVDIWDFKIAKEMRGLVEIFAEVVSGNKIVAPSATIYDQFGKVAATFPDGLPAKVSFTMGLTSNAFELEVGDQRIKQWLFEPNR